MTNHPPPFSLQLRQHRNHLNETRGRLLREIEDVDKKLQALDVLEGVGDIPQFANPVPGGPQWENMTLREAAREMLRQMGGPMRMAAIVKELQRQPLKRQYASADLYRSVRKAMLRSDDFQYDAGAKEWSLSERVRK